MELNDLNFTSGLRAKPLNENFNLIKDWIERERKRIGGWGIVEGFDIKIADNYFVNVSPGLMINEDGKEVFVDGKSFVANKLKEQKISENVYGTANGEIEIGNRPFSRTDNGYMDFIAGTAAVQPKEDEIKIIDTSTGKKVLIKQITNNRIYIAQNIYDGVILNITYYTTSDRIDSILLHKDGRYEYVENIVSESPSHVDLGDYDDTYMIAAVYWDVDRNITGSYYTDHRTYRKVFVDSNNVLYLNGKIYNDRQMIYFEEPEAPLPDDIWYDRENNMLMIWQQKDGVYGWLNINQKEYYHLRESRVFTPDYVPQLDSSGNKTIYLFDENETNLRYIPNTNALEIIIDNQVLMKDQYVEVVQPGSKDYLAAGIGFQLLAELDRPTYVQVNVHHVVQTQPLRETFQRAAVFVSDNYFFYNTTMDKTFELQNDYILGEQQLEVYENGVRLIPGKDYVEMVSSTKEAVSTDKGKSSRYFRIVTTLYNNDCINVKISRWVWSYDQLNMMIEEIDNNAADAIKSCERMDAKITEIDNNVSATLTSIDGRLNSVETALNSNNYMLRTDKIGDNELTDSIKSRLMGDEINIGPLPVDTTMILDDVLDQDYIVCSYTNSTSSRILIKDIDYTRTEMSGEPKTTMITISPDLVLTGATVYITGFKKGR